MRYRLKGSKDEKPIVQHFYRGICYRGAFIDF